MSPWSNLLELPRPKSSRRITFNGSIPAGESKTFDLLGPGCVRHWWFTYGLINQRNRNLGHDIRLRVRTDGETAVDQPLLTFFGTVLDAERVTFKSHLLTVLKNQGLNCWFPIPYADGAEFEFENEAADDDASVWFMADIHQYEDATEVPPLRFRTDHRRHEPEDRTFVELANLQGGGFVAGLVHGTDGSSDLDSWYHTGGDTWLLDGPTDPHVLRGIGGEDTFGYSFGVTQSTSLWQGAPYVDDPGDRGSGEVPCICYRQFVQDPVVFDNGAIIKFGAMAGNLETVVYAYVDRTETGSSRTIETWHLCGPFDGRTFEAFDAEEFPEEEGPSDRTFVPELPNWQPKSGHTPDKAAGREVGRWVRADAEDGWIDFLDYFAGLSGGNFSAAGDGGAAYALGSLEAERAGEVTLRLAFDDWLKLWINGEQLHTIRHDHGFETTRVRVPLRAGDNRLLLKLSNAPNREFLCWAMHVLVDDHDGCL